MRLLRQSVVMVSVTVALALVGAAAYGEGIQNHTSNGITHGCPFDPGCTGTSASAEKGDFNKHGYNRCSSCGSDKDMDYSLQRIRRISDQSIKAKKACYNCQRSDVEFDTNPTKECKFQSGHYAEGPALNRHAHYTESAFC